MNNRMAKVDKWLAEHGARNIRHEELDNGDMLDWITVSGRVMILQMFAKDDGWDMYLPATDDNSTDRALQAMEARLGIK